ncbi:MAG: ECF transporter S component [Coriobacteriales bacterium]|nr:ECF transporter S component [Coriobacteriales bacterium]
MATQHDGTEGKAAGAGAADAGGADGKKSPPARRARWSAQQLATMALFTALCAGFAFIPLPIFPPAALFGITYDPANVPAMLGGIGFGPGAGCLIGVLGALLHGLLASDYVGTLMNVVVVIAFVLPCALICRGSKTTPRLIIGLIVASIISVAAVIPMNLLIWPQFYGIPLEETLTYVVPLMLPFNILKALLNSVLSFLLYKSLRYFLEPSGEASGHALS